LIRLRQATEEDLDFLFDLKKANMKDYVEKVKESGWEDVDQYKNFFKIMPLKKIKIIILDGKEIGYLLFYEGKKYVSYEYLIISQRFQNLGIGSYISEWVFAYADKVRKPVFAQVLKINEGAKHLWLRLGFVVSGETDTHFNLIRKSTEKELRESLFL